MAIKKIHTNVKTFNDVKRALDRLQIQLGQLTGTVGGIAGLPVVATTRKETRFTFLATGSPVSV